MKQHDTMPANTEPQSGQTIQRPACRKRATSSNTPCSVILPTPLQAAIIARADAEDRSFSATVRVALERYLRTPG